MRMVCKPGSVREACAPLDDHSSAPVLARGGQAANPDLGLKRPCGGILTDRPRVKSLFDIAPGGACHAGPVARPAVGSYPTVSPLPCMHGGLFSVALSLGLPRPGVTRHRRFMEPGLSSRARPRGHPTIRIGLAHMLRTRAGQWR
ncbi:hypothetical protein ROE7235_00188 [Roseibaca ekhonensis]|uniref:Uncharacterized protein n=1 Tax=Roseinatronobacter ekhonensis TaxID=254356 RepID=A0A3B0MR79_9RHOB|nr:hypothetical protein ROE7235_00188 [Roseibaca ekhonensis]